MKNFFIASTFLFFTLPAGNVIAQTSQSSSQTSTGSNNRLSVTISNSNGVSSSATSTPNFDVYTSAKLIVGPGSTSFQDVTDPAASISASGQGNPAQLLDSSGQLINSSYSSNANGVAQGAASTGNIQYGEGTAYEVKITPKDVSGKARDSYSTATGSATGTVSTQLSIDSTNSNFVNTFLSSF